ncbi:MAG: hypothetical protein HC925_07105 [Coleofasciculaceae cyanobacterium SM2_3_26]|nr:hypothetical protein [Coleofasciculaceae cyanobacterium SM2_3_26]
MQILKPQLKVRWLFTAAIITLIAADTLPHPSLAPGLLSSTISKIQQATQQATVGEPESLAAKRVD